MSQVKMRTVERIIWGCLTVVTLAIWENSACRAQSALKEDHLEKVKGNHTTYANFRQAPTADSLDEAQKLWSQCHMAAEHRDFNAAENYIRRALAIYQKLSPDSADFAGCLNDLGNVIYERNKTDYNYPGLKAAEVAYRQSLAIFQKIDPGSPRVANGLFNLSDIAFELGDLEAAEENARQAHAIYAKIQPGSADEAASLGNLGLIAYSRGRLGEANTWFQQALTIQQKIVALPQDVTLTLDSLGDVAADRGDLEAAENYYQQALAIRKMVAKSYPDPLGEAECMRRLGDVVAEKNDLKSAAQLYKQALDIAQRAAPGSVPVATILGNLATVTISGNLATAEETFNKALAIYKMAIDALSASGSPHAGLSLSVSAILIDLGKIADARGDLKTALTKYQAAYDLRHKFSPGSLDEARSLGYLAQLYLKRNETKVALPLLQKASEIVQDQRGAIGDPGARTLFADKYFNVFTLLARTYLRLHQPEQALESLEKNQARTLAEQRAERLLLTTDLSSSEVPAELLQLQRQIDSLRNITLKQRQRLNNKNTPEAWRQNTSALDQIAAHQRQLEAEIRRRSPHYAGLVYPAAPTLHQIQQGLEEGELVLRYALDEKECHLFSLTRTSLKYYSLPIPGKTLEELAIAFRKQLSDPDDLRDYTPPARRLYKILIAPAQVEVNQARRLLLCPNGALYQIPFAALLRPKTTHMARDRFLIEDKSLSVTMSLGVYLEARQEAEARKRQPLSPNRVPLYALGNPMLPETKISQATSGEETDQSEVKRFVRLGGGAKSLAPIPQTEALAQRLGKAYGGGSIVRVGAAATKRSVLTEAPRASIVHFGCHALLDNGDPLASCLALTPEGGKNDGFLYAYEVLGMRLPGTHVVLGACETGLGGLSQSEGVTGLTRAFLYAGADNVVVSLWSVEVNSTVALLERLHTELRRGKGMSEAVRTAQLSLLYEKDRMNAERQSPKCWAAFLNYGLPK